MITCNLHTGENDGNPPLIVWQITRVYILYIINMIHNGVSRHFQQYMYFSYIVM
jgi:hypothetical protein